MRTPYDVIIKPVISETSMDNAQVKKYTFKVATNANKTEVKKAVEEIFGVQVEKVNIMNVQGKVAVQMVIDTSGLPHNCSVVRAEPSGYFEEAAIAAASSMRFTPGKLKGQPVNTVVLLPFTFRLR